MIGVQTVKKIIKKQWLQRLLHVWHGIDQSAPSLTTHWRGVDWSSRPTYLQIYRIFGEAEPNEEIAKPGRSKRPETTRVVARFSGGGCAFIWHEVICFWRIECCSGVLKNAGCLKVGSTTRVHGPSWRVSKNAPEFSGRQLGPWTRAVNSGSGNRP